jgi:hypothetical protein
VGRLRRLRGAEETFDAEPAAEVADADVPDVAADEPRVTVIATDNDYGELELRRNRFGSQEAVLAYFAQSHPPLRHAERITFQRSPRRPNFAS